MNGESSPMPKSWFDPRVPSADLCVLRPLLDRHAAATPDKVFARFADGTQWTYRQTQAIARRTAIGLAALGIAQGDKVLSWLPNGPDAIRVWFGLNYLGAVYVPINLAYRGRLLAHVVANSDARLIVAHGDLLGRLADIDRAALTAAVVLGGAAPAVPGSPSIRRPCWNPPTARHHRSRARSRRGTCRPSSTPRARPVRPRA
jgi:crotonobetaine/carnitine-CoA ligase